MLPFARLPNTTNMSYLYRRMVDKLLSLLSHGYIWSDSLTIFITSLPFALPLYRSYIHNRQGNFISVHNISPKNLSLSRKWWWSLNPKETVIDTKAIRCEHFGNLAGFCCVSYAYYEVRRKDLPVLFLVHIHCALLSERIFWINDSLQLSTGDVTGCTVQRWEKWARVKRESEES